MKRFSARIGVAEVPHVIQIDAMSDVLRNSIWNFIVSLFSDTEAGWWTIAEHMSQFFLKLPVDELPDYNIRRREWIKKHYYAMNWFAVYDFVEFVCLQYASVRKYTNWDKSRLQAAFNKIFEEELSGYRFIGGELVPISNTAEIAAIEGAVELSSRTGLTGAHAHIVTALQLLGKRPEPDYRNSIKEAISAVESMAKQLGTSDAQGLAGALDELGKQFPVHGALRSAFIKLYGFDEAKYMAVVCSAFVNYLGAKAQASSVLPKR
jgi:hypothetical protein